MSIKKIFNNPIVWAICLVLVGTLVLLSTTHIINIAENVFFYIAVGVIGVVLHIVCFMGSSKEYSLLIPGGAFFVFSVLFLACEYSEVLSVTDLWPVLILAFGVGFLEQKLFTKGKQGSWVSIILVFAIGVFFLVQENMGFGIALGIIFILIGIIVGVISYRKKQNNQVQPAKDEFDLNN